MTAALCALIVLALGARYRPAPRRVVELVDRAVTQGGPEPRSRLASWRRLRRRSRRPVDPGDVARWCGDVAAACRAGDSLPTAIRRTPPPASAAGPVDALVLALDRGVPLVDAATTIDPVDAHLDLALTVIRACAATGGAAAEPLDRAASALRGRAAEAADRRTHSAQARLSAVVMTVLPTAMLLLLVLTSASIRAVVATPLGLVCIGAGVALNVVGWRWMRGLIDGAAR